MKSKLNKIKFWLQLWDGVWSIPLAMVSFLGCGVIIQRLFTDPSDPQGAPGFFDPSYIQLAFYAAAMLVFINTVVWLGLYFNFRGLWKYLVGYKDENGQTVNPSKDDFKNLKSWQKIVVFLFVYCFLSGEWLLLFSLLR